MAGFMIIKRFKRYVKPLITYIKEVNEDAVIKAHGEKVWRGFVGWCEGIQYCSEAEDMYRILQNMPKNRISRVLGADSYDALTHLEDVVGWDSFSDMRLANIGERNDGAIIWFDI